MIIKTIDSTYIDKVIALQEIIIATLPDKKIYCPSSKDELLAQLNGQGICVGVEIDSQLIAFSTILFPSANDNLGNDVGFSDEDLEKVCHKELTLVHPDFRGQGLQRKMFIILQAKAKDAGYGILMCTVAPENPYSLNNNLKNGMQALCVKRKYNDTWRIILSKLL